MTWEYIHRIKAPYVTDKERRESEKCEKAFQEYKQVFPDKELCKDSFKSGWYSARLVKKREEG